MYYRNLTIINYNMFLADSITISCFIKLINI